MHGKALRNKYTDNHAQSPDSGKYQHAKACNRAEKTANWLAIDYWKLIFTIPVNSTPEKGAFPWYKLIYSCLIQARNLHPE